jgi:hypothetical protein
MPGEPTAELPRAASDTRSAALASCRAGRREFRAIVLLVRVRRSLPSIALTQRLMTLPYRYAKSSA